METIEIADTVMFVDEESREHGHEISLTTNKVDDFQTVKCRSEYSMVSTCEEITDKASRTRWKKIRVTDAKWELEKRSQVLV